MSLTLFLLQPTPTHQLKREGSGEFELITSRGNGSELNADCKGWVKMEPPIWGWREGRKKLSFVALGYKNVSMMHSMSA